MAAEQAIFTFKPDAEATICPREGRDLNQVASRLFSVALLGTVEQSVKTLTIDEVYAIYGAVLQPNPEDDAIWGTAWKDEVVLHLTSAPITSYLLEGTEAYNKARAIKRSLRNKYVEPGVVVRNIAHVPDPTEIPIVKPIIFGSYDDTE